uniref:Activator of Hsp90 ATPase AHSA1-like N-terminal domain-containing protein n=1 Tax=Ditylenchus dipsaci TaxID=166011 RepID=A0A915ER52_9BILA
MVGRRKNRWNKREQLALGEKNATPWSENRLKELLIGKTWKVSLSPSSLSNFPRSRESHRNNRKAKLIFLFEWTLEIKLLLLDENEADEVDINVDMKTKGPDTDDIDSFSTGKGWHSFENRQESTSLS